MKNSKIEQLTNMAFGDSPLVDPSTLSGAELRELENLKHLRQDLRLLGNVPEPQISIDRVRDAILREGLKPQAEPKFGWSWFAMPLATCAIAFAIVFFRPKANVNPNIVLNPNLTAVNSKFDRVTLGSGDSDLRGGDLGNMISQPVGTYSSFIDTTGEVSSSSRDRSSSNSDSNWGISRPDPNRPLIIWPPVTDSSPAPQSDVAKIETVALKQDESSGLILIDQDRDNASMTPRATEVGSPSNVLVGG